MEELLNISGPAAFTFVSVFVAVLGFIYKVWGDVYQAKKQEKNESVDYDENKVHELDSRVYMLEKQMKDIPKKLEELSELMRVDDEKIHKKLDIQIGEIKEMIKENKESHAENYSKLENRIYDLIKNPPKGDN